ncbi:DUF72 domain-containing protein [Sphingomonas suaedae]|uniref:DUF72 domain-containing protein n=1 Tax=Sphingomonas suaedae TaxID=2599297 RepID=A0A518RC89_9SPHN|nr:DUF72 domain-containing protein [Sphingomonas suaedae]QDX25082.1 DUF72 domain-containing protein [Sphingomonas suaedae]
MRTVVGTAGWSIARADAERFPSEGTALERYSKVFEGVEINSSFHRTHRSSTWAKWAECVPARFRFAVKVPKTITHQAKLIEPDALISLFAEEIRPLGKKLELLLVQLPPSLAFDTSVAARFFEKLHTATDGRIVCEPRHRSWFVESADRLLAELRVARAAAEPALSAVAARPGGWPELEYWRLHGSPDMYRSSYTSEAIDCYARQISQASAAGRQSWCIFDNTAAGAAIANALSLVSMLGQREGERAGYVGRPKSAHRSPRPRVVGDVPRTRRAIMDSSHTDTQPRPNLSAEPGEKDLAPNSRTETQPRPNITTEHQQEGDARSPSDTLDRGQRNGDRPSNRADQA